MAKKKKYIVLARNEKTAVAGVETAKGKRSFGDKSAMWISDAGEAREIEKQYGRNVAVTTDQQYEWSVNNDGQNGTKMNNTHHYTFQVREKPALRKYGKGEEKRMFGMIYVFDGVRFVPKNEYQTETLTVAQGAEVDSVIPVN